MSIVTQEQRVQPLLVCGAAGSGKSYFIQQYAKLKGLEMLVCPCRIDRTLREQRTKLHEYAHRLQPSILWLEGADDLTPEAQSFLRRILETNSPSIHFILECRSIESIQEPIKSRCLIKTITPPTYGQLKSYAQRLNLTDEQFNEAYNCWPPSKRTWRQVYGLKYMINSGLKVYFNKNQWNNLENELEEMDIKEQCEYLKCRYIGGNPFAFAAFNSALREERKKQAEEKDGKRPGP